MAKVPAGFKSFLGFIVNGDLAGETFYTSRRGYVVAFPKSPPLRPPTVEQIDQRNKFRTAAALWRQMRPGVKWKWKRACKVAGLRVSGYALLVSMVALGSTSYVETIEHQSGVKLLPVEI